MFKRARLTLTAWYLLILLVISAAFSSVIFFAAQREIHRFSATQRVRFEEQLARGDRPILLGQNARKVLEEHDSQLEAEVMQRVAAALILINGGILAGSAVLAYFLAGKTLQPIQSMVLRQQQFISDASHELRTPLTALRINLEIALRDKKLSVKSAKEILTDNLEDVVRLQSLADALLHLQTASEQSMSNHERISVAETITKSIDQVSAAARAKKITVEYSKNQASSTHFVSGNQEQLIKSIVILLENAIKYSFKNSVVTIKSERKKGMIEISITDTGIGISPADLPSIFNRLFRADAARTHSNQGGFGLGLAIAREIITAHKGTIQVQTKLEKGSTFTIAVPRIS